MNERQTIDRGWFYVHTKDGRRRRLHGYPGKIEVLDERPGLFHLASMLRAAADVGFEQELGERVVGTTTVTLRPNEKVLGLREKGTLREGLQPARRVLFFESLMNSDMPHNDTELSQGVLHMVSALPKESQPVFANVKMSISGVERPVAGLEELAAILAAGPVDLVCLTVLEGYFEGVVALIQTLRTLGCRAHIAVGGVMPTLTPEHVAAHLPEVSFICRGAGEVFVAQLASWMGGLTVDEPFSEALCSALLSVQGLLAIDRSGRRLIAADIDQSVLVPELDRVKLRLDVLERRHIQGGIEISTSRGCIHRCSFCSIMGRESYQARSVGGVLEVMDTYQARFHELFGEDVPANAYRVHFADDDFACDRERARDFFLKLPETPFRLSSVQVSVADLCVREKGRLLPKVDSDLLDAIRPECFADHGRPIPIRDFVEDFKSRSWSSFLQLGVESYSDRELIRLGKGYRVAHVRAVVAELSRRKLHMDGYFILSNGATSAEDLIDVLDELCRLKLFFPVYFHIRFPIVPRLVSYFPSASHRRWIQKDRADLMVLRHFAKIDGYPEFDYPFVDSDTPQDEFVAAVTDGDWFTDVGRYTESFSHLRTRWETAIEDGTLDPERGLRLIRALDDRTRRLLFSLMETVQKDSRGEETPWRDLLPSESAVLETTESLLGPAEKWLPGYRRYVSNEAPRLVVIPTWECELRCRYCFIPKQSGRVMSWETMRSSLDFLMSSERSEVLFQFFGGEALIEADLVFRAMDYGLERAKACGKTIGFILSSNGWTLTKERVQRLARYPVKLELSLDGDRHTQNAQRRALLKGADSYDNSVSCRAEWILESGLAHEVIMVVHPEFAHKLRDNFFHIADLGYTRIQINHALGFVWTPEQQTAFATSLHQIGRELKERWGKGETVQLINLLEPPMPMRLNGEVTVDFDGTLYGGNGFLHETEHKSRFVAGHLRDGSHFDRHWLDIPANEVLLSWSYPEEVTENNLAVAAVFTSFLKWMRQEMGLS